MARGWESKAVADQIEDRELREHDARQSAATSEQRILLERLHSLKLSRSRLLQQLEHARHPAHRDILLNGLNAVNKDIEDLSNEVKL